MKNIIVQGRQIGAGSPPLIVAEMSGNHNQSLKLALDMIDAAAASGAHAFKLQTYTADTMTLDIAKGEFFIHDPKSLWKGKSLYQLYQEAHTPWEWHAAIFAHCKKRRLLGFSTPFDIKAVDFLESLHVPCYKIASAENVDLPLIRRVAATGKPIIISTGMASIAELDEAVRTARQAGCRELILLKCTSAYPCPPEEVNLLTLPHLQSLFDCPVGLSDHTQGIGVSLAAVALGAQVIERHFTLNRADGGVDAAFSLEPQELQMLVTESARAAKALGKIVYGPTSLERNSLQYRRSLYITRDLKAGEQLNKSNVRAIRPGLGLSPKFLGDVLGRRVRKKIKRGTPLSWSLL